MPLDITCPTCGAEFDIELARNDDDWRDLVKLIMSLPDVVHRPLWQYLTLFQGKQRLKSLKMYRIVKELELMIRDANVKRGHATYRVPAEMFAKAMTYLVDARPGSLVLPLKGNGYLLGMLANQAEKVLNNVEKQHEENVRKRVKTVTPGHASHAMYIPGQNTSDESTFSNPVDSLSSDINKPTEES